METIQKGLPQARLDAMKEAASNSKTLPTWNPEEGIGKTDSASRMDAADSLWVARQLEQLRAGLYEIAYPQLKAKSMLSFNTTIPQGVVNFTVRAIDRAGIPKLIRGKAKDIPNVEMVVNSATITFQSFALAYSFTQQEIAEAQYAGMPLQAMKATATRELMAQWMDRFALIGDAKASSTDSYTPQGSGIGGFFTSSGTLTYSPTVDGAGGTTTFATKAPDSVINDLGQILTQPVTQSLGVESIDTCLLPLGVFNYLNERRIGDGTSEMILPFMKRNNSTVRFDWSAYLTNIGASNGTRAVAYRNDPSILEMIVSQEFDQGPPQWDGLSVDTICTMRTAGVALYRPQAVIFADGI